MIAKSLLRLLMPLCLLGGVATHSAAQTVVSVTQVNYDVYNRPVCTAVRMNPAVYGTISGTDACALGTTGAYGPDRITKTIYDAAGQVQQTWQAVGTSDTRAYATYNYSSNGKLIDTIDANGNHTILQYDSFDRLATLFYPSPTRPSAYNPSTPANALATAGSANGSDFEVYGYDSNGNRIAWRRRDGQTFYYTFDAVNRETKKDVPGTTTDDVYTGYDGVGHVLWRRFVSTTGPGTQYWYNAFGEVTASTDMNGHSIWMGSRYHNGVDTALVWPDGLGLNTDDRDALGRVKTAYFGTGGLVAYTGTYDSLGHLIGIGRQGGSTSYGYDNLGRLTSMGNNLNGTTYDINWTFAYNPAGQLYTSTASSTTYDYKETVNSSDGPTYDGLNRDTRLVGQTQTCPLGGYDARQNLICDSKLAPYRTFTYDVENRMLTGVSTNANVKMVYDPEGRLSKYSIDGGSTWYTLLYYGTRLIAYYDNSGAMVARYIHGDGTDNPLVWMVGADTSNMRPLYTDYHGSVIADTDSSGNMLDVYKYGPYGEPKDISNNEFWGGSAFRYTGQIALPQLQLYYYKARVYDPKWGRFLQTDPIGSKDDLDLYAYTADDPVNRSDPTGTDSWLVTESIPGTGANHTFVVVADKLGGEVTARFSYGPTPTFPGFLGAGTLVELSGSKAVADVSDAKAWASLSDPSAAAKAGNFAVQIPASDANVIAAGRAVDTALGTKQNPGNVGYSPNAHVWTPDGKANSNSASHALVDNAVARSGGDQSQVKPKGWAPGWELRERVLPSRPGSGSCKQTGYPNSTRCD